MNNNQSDTIRRLEKLVVNARKVEKTIRKIDGANNLGRVKFGKIINYFESKYIPLVSSISNLGLEKDSCLGHYISSLKANLKTSIANIQAYQIG